MAFIEPMHRNKPNITYLLTSIGQSSWIPTFRLWQLRSHCREHLSQSFPYTHRPMTTYLSGTLLTLSKTETDKSLSQETNGHNHLWGSPHDDTRGQVIERFTNLHDLCILNDGTHTYLKPQAQHVNSPTSAIDLTMCTPGVALRCNWEVIPDSHGSDHYPVLTSVSPTSADANQGVHDPTHWVFSRADWEGFMGVCQERIDDAVLQSPDPLQSFVDPVIKIADDFIPKASSIPRKSNPWFDQECRDALKTRRALDNKVKRGCGPHQETLISFKRAQARVRRLFNQKKRDSWRNYVSQLTTNTPIKHVWDRVGKISGKNICPPSNISEGKMVRL